MNRRKAIKSFMLATGAQQTVNGRVTDVDGNPLEGVTVREKGTNVATNTDINGNYEIIISDSGNTPTYKVNPQLTQNPNW